MPDECAAPVAVSSSALPDDRARSSPAITRSLIIGRSNSLITPTSQTASCRMGCWYPGPPGVGRGRCREPVARLVAQSGLTGIIPPDTPTMQPRCRTLGGPTPVSRASSPDRLPRPLVLLMPSSRYTATTVQPSRLAASWSGLQLVLNGLALVAGRYPDVEGGAAGCWHYRRFAWIGSSSSRGEYGLPTASTLVQDRGALLRWPRVETSRMLVWLLPERCFHCTGHAPAEGVRGSIDHSFHDHETQTLRTLGRWPPQGEPSMTDWWEWLLWVIGVWSGIVVVALAIFLHISPRR